MSSLNIAAPASVFCPATVFRSCFRLPLLLCTSAQRFPDVAFARPSCPSRPSSRIYTALFQGLLHQPTTIIDFLKSLQLPASPISTSTKHNKVQDIS